MEFLIGTSGWQYDDWVGIFYPMSIRAKKSEWLHYYGEYFATTEINSSFYSVPSEQTVKTWIAKGRQIARDNSGHFEFSLKLHQDITHAALVDGDEQGVFEKAHAFERRVVQPLAENGLLGAVLIQLSPYARYDSDQSKAAATLALYTRLFELLKTDQYNYALEFRHRSWLGEPSYLLKADVEALLSNYNVASVCTDGPGFPWTRHNRANHAYIRLHGRNRDIWFKGDRDRQEQSANGPDTTIDGRLNRYDYLYSLEELKKFVPRFQKIAENVETVRIYLNNHPFSKSVANAFQIMDLLGIEHKEKDLTHAPVETKTQKTLFDF